MSQQKTQLKVMLFLPRKCLWSMAACVVSWFLMVIPWSVAHGMTSELTANVVVKSAEVRLAEPFEFRVVISWKGKAGEFEIDPPQQLSLEGLELLQSSVSNQTTPADGLVNCIRTYRYLVLPKVEGKATIGSLHLSYRQRTGTGDDPAQDQAETLKLATTPLPLTVLPPLKKIVVPWHAILSATGMTLFVILFAWFLRRKKRVERPMVTEEEQSPLLTLKKAFDDNERLIIDGEAKEYFVRAEKLMLVYLEAILNEQLAGLATPQLLQKMEHLKIDEDDRKLLENFLNMTNLVKFAGMQPEQDEIRRTTRALYRLAEKLAG